MRVPKEIVDEVEKYQIAKKQMDDAFRKVEEWLRRKTTLSDNVVIDDIYIADKPAGIMQNYDGEIRIRDKYNHNEGEYYHQIEDSDKYVGYHYWY